MYKIYWEKKSDEELNKLLSGRLHRYFYIQLCLELLTDESQAGIDDMDRNGTNESSGFLPAKDCRTKTKDSKKVCIKNELKQAKIV